MSSPPVFKKWWFWVVTGFVCCIIALLPITFPEMLLISFFGGIVWGEVASRML